MARYTIQPRDRIFVKAHGFLSFAKNMGNNIGKNISKNLSGNSIIMEYQKNNEFDR